MKNLSSIDILLIILYFGLVLFIGTFKSWKTIKDPTHYLLAGRKLTLPAFVATLVASWYGGILGIGEFTFLYGISNWFVFGVPYYLAALIFALFVAQRARRENLYTIPEQLERAYGRQASLLGAFFIFLIATPAAYVLMLGVLIHFFFGWPLWFCVLVGTLFTMCYVYIGGFGSVVRTDILQFMLMYLGFGSLIIFSVTKYGGWDFLQANLPPSHFVWHGGQGPSYILVWYFIALATLIDPSFYQRCFAVKDERSARIGILISILFWVVFDLLSTTAGLYARAVLKDLSIPINAYLELAQNVLPSFFHGLFLIALLATVMSTLDSYSFLAAMTIGHDVVWRIKKNHQVSQITRYTRIGIVLMGLFSILIALYAQSVIKIWKDVGSIITPALLIPLLTTFSKKYRLRNKMAPIMMLSGAGLALIWLVLRQSGALHDSALHAIEPIYPGLAITALLFLIDRLCQYGGLRISKRNKG